jgi:triosephosphate isomerase
MRQKIVAGNWKMNETYSEGLALFRKTEKLLTENPVKDVKVIIAPAFIFISEFAKMAGPISIAAQNCSNEAVGAFTGEVSASMVKSAGAEYVITGHSERRKYYNETNEILAKKMLLALHNSLIPIFCIGESLDERNEGGHLRVIKQQLTEGVFHLTKEHFSKIILAYEPVWAIGTGITASAFQVQEMHAYIRSLIVEKYGVEIAGSSPVLYGGSCTSLNARELFSCPDVDGGLIGGASLKADDFVQIIHSFKPKANSA